MRVTLHPLLDAVSRSADLVAALGGSTWGPRPSGSSSTGARTCGGGSARTGPAARGGVLVLAHHDTVWPLGSLETHPFSVRDGVLRGPGCFDMKAGLVLALHALAELGESAVAGVTLLVTGDEELGSPTSRGLIEAEAAGCRAALVLEASADGGALKTARKGVSLYEVRAVGRAAHAGLEPERGVNATVELAHQVLAVRRARRRRARHDRDADGAVVGDGVEHRARDRGVLRGRADVGHRRAGAGARGDELAAARGARRGAPGERRAEPAAARRVVVGRRCSRSPSSAGRRARPAAAHVGGGRRRVRRQLHRRAWARRRSTGLARSAAGRMLTMSTCSSDALPGRAALLAALIDALLTEPMTLTCSRDLLAEAERGSRARRPRRPGSSSGSSTRSPSSTR